MAEGMRDRVVPERAGLSGGVGLWPDSEGVCFVSGKRSSWGLSALLMSLY